MKLKFTDKELIEENKKGLSDKKIARIFECSLSTINKRRYKLGLVANFENFKGERNTKEECLNNAKKLRERRAELIRKQYPTKKFKAKEKLRSFKRRQTSQYQDYHKKYNKEYWLKTKLKNLPIEVVNGILSAIDDVRNGRYIIVEKSASVI